MVAWGLVHYSHQPGVVLLDLCGASVARQLLHCTKSSRVLLTCLASIVQNVCACVHVQVNDQLPEAFSLLGYAFYLQPLIMPIIREMPEGRAGRQALTAAVHTSLLGEQHDWGQRAVPAACHDASAAWAVLGYPLCRVWCW